MEGDIYNASEIIDKLRKDIKKLESDSQNIWHPPFVTTVYLDDLRTISKNIELLEKVERLEKENLDLIIDYKFISNLYFFVCLILVAFIIYLL